MTFFLMTGIKSKQDSGQMKGKKKKHDTLAFGRIVPFLWDFGGILIFFCGLAKSKASKIKSTKHANTFRNNRQ